MILKSALLIVGLVGAVVAQDKPPGTVAASRPMRTEAEARARAKAHRRDREQLRLKTGAEVEMTMDIPEYSKMKRPGAPRDEPVTQEDRDYHANRSRGLGGNPTTGAEENLPGYTRHRIPMDVFHGKKIRPVECETGK